MKKTATIKNLTNRSRTFNLPHSEVCAQSQVCHCSDGRPASLFLPAHGTLENLDPAVRFSGEIKAAATRLPKPDIKVTICEASPKKKAARKSADGGHGSQDDTSPPQGKDDSKGKKKKRAE